MIHVVCVCVCTGTVSMIHDTCCVCLCVNRYLHTTIEEHDTDTPKQLYALARELVQLLRVCVW
jgi:hypothetical protein